MIVPTQVCKQRLDLHPSYSNLAKPRFYRFLEGFSRNTDQKGQQWYSPIYV